MPSSSSSDNSVKLVSILGSTGSIGRQSLDVIAAFPDRFRVCALTAGSNVRLLCEQIKRFHPQLVCVLNETDRRDVIDFCAHHGCDTQVISGEAGLIEAGVYGDPHLLIVAVVGTASLRPTLRAIHHGITIGLACKEVLVAAGDMIMALARQKGVEILPIDSEHAALKQCLAGIHEDEKYVSQLVLTASGGPFWNRSVETFASITRDEALCHPNWAMGSKITVDSATMMNKGLEVIEAHHLFGIDYHRLNVVIHPTSIVHSMVEFSDGTFLAQMGMPDMRFPIQYVLTYPEKLENAWPKMNLASLKPLVFHDPDYEKFPLLKLAFEAGVQGGTAPVVLNAANEAVVQLFLEGKLSFVEISRVVSDVVQSFSHRECRDLEDIVALDRYVKAGISELFLA
jgi:1-deoxy-D-xylulose-5-phosphate reductoisomerase